MTKQAGEWVQVSATVPSHLVGSLTVWIGDWIDLYDVQPGNVRHLLPGGAPEPDFVEVSFTLPPGKVEPFYVELANWWRRVEQDQDRGDTTGD